jgi:DNA invertase Pin-like site-specific DNA recombinase
MHGIKVLMAKNYIDNLSEEARKGMQEKAEQGIWPTKTPLGYRNTTGPDGKKIIAAEPASRGVKRLSVTLERRALSDIASPSSGFPGMSPTLPDA